MCKLFRSALLVLSLLISCTVNAQIAMTHQEAPKLKGAWFASGVYSFNIANNNFTYSRLGVMGGYLNNWGGYAKVDFPLIGSWNPNVSIGVTKRLTTFNNKTLSNPSTLHWYFGVGYGWIEHCSEWREHDHINYPDGTSECLFDTERTTKSWDETAGILIETGLIYRYRHLNFMLGYSITPDIAGALNSSGQSANMGINIGVGYTF